MRGGKTAAQPFPSPHPFVAALPCFAGASSRILNPPDLTRFASASAAAHSRTAVMLQSAGGAKAPVPYSLSAARSRIRSEGPPSLPPFVSKVVLGGGRARSAHPWRTTSEAAFAPSKTPMDARTLFEFPDVARRIAARLKVRMYN